MLTGVRLHICVANLRQKNIITKDFRSKVGTVLLFLFVWNCSQCSTFDRRQILLTVVKSRNSDLRFALKAWQQSFLYSQAVVQKSCYAWQSVHHSPFAS